MEPVLPFFHGEPERTMKRTPRGRNALLPALLLMSFSSVGVLLLAGPLAQDTPLGDATPTAGRPQDLLRGMVGTWNVGSRMWTGPGAQPMSLPPAVATRRLIGDVFLEEVMTPAAGAEGPPFTRIAYLDYNDVNHRYEWISMDTRAPQMMYERGLDAATTGPAREIRAISLHLDFFVLPQWGKTTSAAFRQRRVIEVGQDRQVTRQYWTQLSGVEAEEFLAMEYVYTRKR